MTEEEKKIKARENAKKYYQKNKEKILARQKEYVRKRYHSDEEFRKKTLDNHKRYEQNNLERVKKIKRDAQKKYYQNHKEYYHNYSKQWSKNKFESLESENKKLHIIIEKVKECANEKIKMYRTYLEDLKRGNYPSPTVYKERQELLYRIQEQEDLLDMLEGDKQ